VKLILQSQLALALTLTALAQTGEQPSTERRNNGFEGPVKSVLTTVEPRNPDPRPSGKRTLGGGVGPQWMVFDVAGTRIEQGTAADATHVVEISKRLVKPDGAEVWTDSSGTSTESTKQETNLTDGSREVKYFTNSKLVTREITRMDEHGKVIAQRNFNEKGRLTSEESTSIDSNGETNTFKMYDDAGLGLHHITRVTRDPERFDRSEYAPNGRLAWSLSLNEYGELLSYYYSPGYKPKFSSSDSLGICRPKLCVSYKFDEQGKLEKHVQHTPEYGNLEPTSEEHYNSVGVMDEKVELKYTRDTHGNWTQRSLMVWDPSSNQMIEVERDIRIIEYY
jgi:hypothetical protein